MTTHHRLRTRTSNDEEEDLFPQTAPEDGGKAMPAEQRPVRARDSSSLAKLLQAAASNLAQLQPAESVVIEGAAEPRRDDVSAAISRQAETSVVQPVLAATIFSQERSAQPAKSEAASTKLVDFPSLL
ncbi:unnamed protein product [Lampetra planeri]